MTPAQPTMGWTHGRMAWGILLLTAAQAVVVLRFAGVPDIPLPRSSAGSTTVLLWTREQSEAAFTGVPGARRDVLERDPADPFQVVAQRSLPAPQYRLAEWREPDRWLTNPPSMRPVPFPWATVPGALASVAIPARVDARPAASRQTVVLPGGGLAGRPWLQSPILPPWPGQESPGVTRLEVAVNPQGWLVVLRVAESSGSREADDAALAALRNAVFQPWPGAAKRPSFDTGGLTWGSLTIAWGLPTPGS